MTVALPGPVPLDMPPGDPAAVDDLVRDLAAAASHLAGVDGRLRGPAAAAPGWRGDDAVAAAGQIARVGGLAATSSAAVLSAAGRLSTHAEVLRDTRRQVEALREGQEEEFRSAQLRLGDMADARFAVMTGGSGWAGVVADVEAAEAGRRRQHAMLLEELAQDAEATARFLADATRPVGGTGRPGDGDRVLVHLAGQLPGWGDVELDRRGRDFGQGLLESTERAELTAEAVRLAAQPAFATALVREVGVEPFALLLDVLGDEPDGPDQPLAAVLAAALGAAVPNGRTRDPVTAVLGATYIRPGDRHSAPTRAAGMAAVLSAGTRLPGGGPPVATVVLWARQLLTCERAQDLPTGLQNRSGAWRDDARDPVQLALDDIAANGGPAAAAELLGEGSTWEALLDRSWADGGIALGTLIETAGREPGRTGARAVRVGLETIGSGLVEGDPAGRTVDRAIVSVVSPALAAAVGAQVDVVATALASVGAGAGAEEAGPVLAGLGHVTVDRRAAAAVHQALVDRAAGAGSGDLDAGSSAGAPPGVTVPAAYLAVQEYGQRMAHALDGFELRDEAQDKAALWSWTAGIGLEAASHLPVVPVAAGAYVLGAGAPFLLGMDGSFDQAPDSGLRFTADAAGADAVAALPPELAAGAPVARIQAEAAYRRTAAVLGSPTPPTSPDRWRLLLDSALGPVQDAATGAHDGDPDRPGRAAVSAPGRR